MTLTAEESELILREARAQGIKVDLPEVAEEMIKYAEQVISQAEEAYSSGIRGEQVTRVLSIRDTLSPVPQGDTEWAAIEPYVPGGPVTQETSGEFTANTQAAVQMIKAEGLPIPGHLDEEPPEMPRDLTDCGDRELRRLHSIFNAYLNRVAYMLGLERADEKAASRILDHEQKRALREIEKVDDNGRNKPQHVLLAEAASDPKVVMWDERLAQHEANLALLYTMRDIYSGNVERISKEWRMRQDEWTKSGGARG